jgi:hypothetical protein
MAPDRWEEIKQLVQKNFEVLGSGQEEIEDIPDSKLEFIEFEGPLGKMRLEFITKPKVLDKKTLYSGRIGSDVKVEYVYSENEKVNTFKAYKWNDEQDDWLEAEFDL